MQKFSLFHQSFNRNWLVSAEVKAAAGVTVFFIVVVIQKHYPSAVEFDCAVELTVCGPSAG
jgi:hypothetical protein